MTIEVGTPGLARRGMPDTPASPLRPVSSPPSVSSHPEVGDGHDVGVLHARRRARVAEEARGQIRVTREIAAQDTFIANTRSSALWRGPDRRSPSPLAEHVENLVATIDDLP